MTGPFLAYAEPWQPCSAQGWSCTSAKRLYEIWLGKMLQPQPLDTGDYEVPYLKALHVQWTGVQTTDLPTMWASPAEIKANRVQEGDLLVCEGGQVGRAARLAVATPASCILQNALHRVRPRTDQDVRYLAYILRHAADQGWFEVLCNKATIAHFTAEKFGEMRVCYPGASIQRAIADYLDRETAQIDALVAAKESLLMLVAEKRRVLITRAVTRGLDPNVPLRDSTVPWLGSIPAHWAVIQFKFACSDLQTGPFGSQLHADEYIIAGTPVINPAHFAGGKICADERVSVDEATADRLAVHRLVQGDIVFARRGEMGRCGVVEQAQEGWLCGTGSLRARLRTDAADPRYIALVFTNTRISDVLAFESVGSTMDNLNTKILGSCQIPLPPLGDQRAIVAHIVTETAKLDALRTATERSIALLIERRAALIAAAVTGQMAIEGALAPETATGV